MDRPLTKEKIQKINKIKNKFIRVQKLLELAMESQVEREKLKIEGLKYVLEQNGRRPTAIKWD